MSSGGELIGFCLGAWLALATSGLLGPDIEDLSLSFNGLRSRNYDSTIDEIYQAINTIWQKFLYVVNSGIYEKKMDLAQLYTEKIDKQNEKSKEIQYEPQSILDLDTHWFDLKKEEIKLETPVQIGLFNKHPLQCNFDFRTRIPETSITDWLLIFVSACVILVLWYMVLNEVITIMGYFKNI